MVSFKGVTHIDQFLLPDVVRLLDEQTAYRFGELYDLTVVGVGVISEGEICAAAEDQGMRMGCGLERKEVQNGSIVYI